MADIKGRRYRDALTPVERRPRRSSDAAAFDTLRVGAFSVRALPRAVARSHHRSSPSCMVTRSRNARVFCDTGTTTGAAGSGMKQWQLQQSRLPGDRSARLTSEMAGEAMVVAAAGDGRARTACCCSRRAGGSCRLVNRASNELFPVDMATTSLHSARVSACAVFAFVYTDERAVRNVISALIDPRVRY